jgi:hypothetical protein
MPLAVYPDFGWFIRAARIFPVVAISAFAGGVMGGYIVFTINGALAPPQRADLQANGQPAAIVRAKPVTIVGGATSDPAAEPSAPAPAQSQIQTPSALPPSLATTAQTELLNAPLPTRWPNALSRARRVMTPAQPPAVTPQPGLGEEEKSAEKDRKSSGNTAASADADRAAARRRARAAKKREPEFSAAAGTRQAVGRAYNGVYDYYGATGDRDAGSAGSSPYNMQQRLGSDERYGARRRSTVRGQRPSQTQPAEAAQPWSGQYWGGVFNRGWQ